MIIKEYRIVMPMTVDEYHIGQLYGVTQESLNQTGGGEGVEILRNEPFENKALFRGQLSSGQYTLKTYHIPSRVPTFIRWIAPKGSLEIQEEAWNAFPFCRTIISNPAYMAENFNVTIDSLHLADRGQSDNVHHLTPDQLSKREVVMIDIGHDPIPSSDYHAETDPAKFHSTKTGRGPLTSKTWSSTCDPVMTCYKLVIIEFKWFGFQSRMERFLHREERRLFTNFHRKLFCWMDTWFGMTIEEIRALEERVRHELAEARPTGEIRGTMIDPNINNFKQ